MYGLFHLFDNGMWRTTALSLNAVDLSHNTVHAKLLVVAVFGFGQSVGKQEDSGKRLDDSFLRVILPTRHYAYRNVGITRQGAYLYRVIVTH